MKTGHGGKRAGAGKPKGTKNQATLSKEAARDVARSLITARLKPLIDAQLAHAEGLKYLVTRDKRTGKFIRVTEAMAKAKSAGSDQNEEIIEVWEKDPSTQAFSDLMNRALDKPKEQEQEIKLTGDQALIEKLLLGRQRAAKRDKPS